METYSLKETECRMETVRLYFAERDFSPATTQNIRQKLTKYISWRGGLDNESDYTQQIGKFLNIAE